MSRTIIGLAGYRKTGKSEIAKHLCEKHGFRSVHPFEVWKEGLKAMYRAIGIDEATAEGMVRGNLKDTPHPELPNGHDSRYLMERVGKFSGTDLGPEWTLGLSLRQVELLYPDANLVIESIVYEVDVVREFGGHIIKIERPGTEGAGLETDAATKLIVPDSSFTNDSDDLEMMKIEFESHLSRHGLLRQCETEMDIA
jgi:hypothetical protein